MIYCFFFNLFIYKNVILTILIIINLNEFNQTKEEKNISDENKDKNNIEIIYNNIKEKKLDEINKDSILKTNNQTKNNKEEKNNKNNINIEKENNKNNIKCIDFV